MKDRCTNDKSMLDRKTFPTILLKIEKEAIKKRKIVRKKKIQIEIEKDVDKCKRRERKCYKEKKEKQ